MGASENAVMEPPVGWACLPKVPRRQLLPWRSGGRGLCRELDELGRGGGWECVHLRARDVAGVHASGGRGRGGQQQRPVRDRLSAPRSGRVSALLAGRSGQSAAQMPGPSNQNKYTLLKKTRKAIKMNTLSLETQKSHKQPK